MADTSKNMTEGNTLKLILLFCVPMLIGNIFQQLYNFADSVIVGKLVGVKALAAIGTNTSLTWLFLDLCIGFSAGGGIIVAQNFGRNETDKVKSCIVNTGYLMILVPIFIGFAAFCASPALLRLLNTPDDIFEDALIYIRLMSIGLFFVSIYNFVTSIMRALGDSKSPLYFLVISSILNVILDFVFIYYFNSGVFGAGLATVISQFVSVLLSLGYAFWKNPYFHISKANLKPNKNFIIQIIKLGIPLSLQYSMVAISCMVLQRVVNGFGAITVAAFTATSRIDQFMGEPYQTMGMALSTFTGQNFGAKKFKRIQEGFKKSFWIMAFFSIVMLPIFQIFRYQIIGFFVNDSEVVEMGAQALKIMSFFYFSLGLIITVRGVLNGIGDAFFALLNGFVEVLGRFTIPFILTAIPAIGVWGIWWSVAFVWTLSALTGVFRYLYKRKDFQE